MKKGDILAAFAGVDHNILWGNRKQKEVVKLYLAGLPVKEIAQRFALSRSRIDQIVARQARRALAYKSLKNDLEYQVLVQKYKKMIENGEKIVIECEWKDKPKHLLAVGTACNGGDIMIAFLDHPETDCP